MSADTQLVEQDSIALNTVQSDRSNSLALITNDENMARITALAKTMAGSKVTVPKHLQGNEGDCMAIIIQATNWGMNPFAVAQKTHLVNGTLGYEAQLVNAVVTTNGFITGSFKYEYKDEVGSGANMSVSCRVGAIEKGNADVTWGEWLNSNSVTTKNSPLWKTNIKQQMGYLQVKNWARLYAPAAIMGVYTADELQELPPKDLNEAPARSRKGADVAREAQQSGVVIDQKQEENRNGLLTALDAFAKKGTIEFTGQWRKLSKPERLLIGEQEYLRLLADAEDVDALAVNQTQDTGAPSESSDSFVAEMNAAEQSTGTAAQ
jgi:hypothetical protein